ncbi:hypothetical protein D0Z07_4336 [Hyphodiscus hymeniophilus]|uniref:Uncharacterized protein n=1 Tax=Hyphodiscus hymeniophilus TaxID=353542 RepID=A0A9P7AXU8_9HELO|nr:hypothetical protein D0Z07_4336 [Hyphodiscus hymeniophilus]
MPPNIEEQQHDYEPNPAFPNEHEDENNQSTNFDSPNDSQSRSQTREPGQAGPTFLSRLSQLPIQRPLPWRTGQDLPPERSSESDRVQQRGASLLAARGTIATEPCTQCAAGRGRFSHCITLGNWFQGACSSCVFTSRGNRCSLRLQRGRVDGRSARHQPVEEGGMNENPNPRARKRRRRAEERGPTIANLINDPPAPHSSQYTSGVAAGSPQTVSPDTAMDLTIKTEVPSEKSDGLLTYVWAMENKQKRYHNPSDTRNMLKSIPGGPPRYQDSSRDQRACQGVGHGGFTAVNGTGTPLNTGPPAPQQVWPPPANRNVPAEAPLQSPDGREQPVPLIDTLPKSKQRQIFGIVSGMQGGIDHLQKQLTLLQASLGIEVENGGARPV